MPVHEIANVAGKPKHDAHREDHGSDHDLDVLSEAHRRDDGIKREDDVDHNDLRYDRHHGGAAAGGLAVRIGAVFIAFKAAMDLMHAFPEEKESAGEEDEV